jgi:hypothetical protein
MFLLLFALLHLYLSELIIHQPQHDLGNIRQEPIGEPLPPEKFEEFLKNSLKVRVLIRRRRGPYLLDQESQRFLEERTTLLAFEALA